MLKRAGRAYDSRGVPGTKPGECAVTCPACPIPGINLPSGWKYSLFVGIDANFVLKRLDVSSEENDPSLNNGMAYFVENKEYMSFLEKYGPLVSHDKSHCNDHNAAKLATFKGGKGVAATGVATIDCARHDMKRPLLVGDLQKGERYVNIDYLLLSSVRFQSPLAVVVSYDIGCIWGIHFVDRQTIYDVIYRPDPLQSYCILVPKFHLYAHREWCKARFSFNYTPHVGRTDGEAPERGWSAINAVSRSTREMGPGSRRDVLDDMFGDWNYRKRLVLAGNLFKRFTEAIEGQEKHVFAFKALSNSLPAEDLARFKEAIMKWEADPNGNMNPFEPKEKGFTAMSLNGVRLELAQEDQEVKDEDKVHDISGRSMILKGVLLEQEQALLATEDRRMGEHTTDLQKANYVERATRLRQKIDSFIEIQHVYMPRLGYLRCCREETAQPEIPTHLLSLWLPSSCTMSKGINHHKFDQSLYIFEYRIRMGEAFDSLGSLRRHLMLTNQLWYLQRSTVMGQRNLTRSQTVLSDLDRKVASDAARYRRAFAALEVLGPLVGSSIHRNHFQILEDKDIRAIDQGEDDRQPDVHEKAKSKYNKTLGEGRRSPSWIWSANQSGNSESVLGEGGRCYYFFA
ncbi:hypothetical protein VKT23_019300 [Stygiomarasmius scandens]|uniref:Uncharacterized protein n=1 Tax=Marasmiellus scandens TaxID=2682957 RepID=A0ABR1IQX9_9AGAR